MKRRFRGRFRPKKRVRWFSNATGYVDRTVSLPLSTAAIIPAVTILAIHKRDAVATADLIENVQQHTIEAIRGEILMTGGFNLDPDASFAALYHGGIRVVDLDPSGAPPFYSPTSPTEADDTWMALWHRVVPPNFGVNGTLPQCTLLDNNCIEVHVKSKRVMKDNQALVLYEQATAVAGADVDMTINVYHYLRTLVSHPE